MSIFERHVRHEIKTREHYKRIGDGKELPDHLGVAWCGPVIYSHEWKFMSTDHVLLALQQGTGIQPCRACLREIQAVLRAELGPVVPGLPPVTERTERLGAELLRQNTRDKPGRSLPDPTAVEVELAGAFEHLADCEPVTTGTGGIPDMCLGCGRELDAYQACANPACNWERGLDDPHFDRRGKR